MQPIELSIIIPVYRDSERLGRCVRALVSQIENLPIAEIIVVNNDPVTRIPQLDSRVKVLEEARPGSYAARNTGIRHSMGAVLGFTDSDCIPEETWIQNALAAFRSDPQLMRLGGRVVTFSEPGTLSLVAKYESVFAFPQDEYVERQGMAATANMFARREVFDKVGLFREDLLSGGDAEWGKRAAAAGISIVYSADVVVRHPARRSVSEVISKAIRVAGGQTEIQFQGVLSAVFMFLQCVLPPIRSFRKLSKTSLRLKDQLGVAALRYRVRLAKGITYVLVAFGHRPRRS